jgi:Flp pilus assembly pilin Flp
MQRVIVTIAALARRDDGQDLLEYGLVAVLIAIVAMVAVTSVGGTINTLWWQPIAENL